MFAKSMLDIRLTTGAGFSVAVEVDITEPVM